MVGPIVEDQEREDAIATVLVLPLEIVVPTKQMFAAIKEVGTSERWLHS